MLAKVTSVAIHGIDAYILEIEVYITHGNLPYIVVVGLPDAAVKESRDRVKAALQNSGYYLPHKPVTVNLAPADRKKEGPSFELPIAIGILVASEQLRIEDIHNYAIVGELALDGRVRPIKGALAMALRCRDEGLKGIILPAENAAEAAVVEEIKVLPVETLVAAVGFLTNKQPITPYSLNIKEIFNSSSTYDIDFADVKGQEHAKRALTVAAAGNHNLIMIGPPGTGKTMLAQRLPTIMPQPTLPESLETTKIYSIAGYLASSQSLIATRPFRAPHHTISEAGMIGGGTYPRPGEVSLSHCGVLFLDELPEFDRTALEALRQPLETGTVTISRASISITYPAQIMLVCATNPCPCGYFTDTRKSCHCTPYQIQKYMSKISGPLLDRIDIHLEVPALHHSELVSTTKGETSAEIREKVNKARDLQLGRYKPDCAPRSGRLAKKTDESINYSGEDGKALTNSRMSSKQVKKHCVLDSHTETLLQQAMMELGLSARGYDKILKVARTIADLEGGENIKVEHISEAIQYRSLDRGLCR